MSDHGGRCTVTGRYGRVPHPCTTLPCLPGMAWALQAGDGGEWIVTVDGRPVGEAHAWSGYAPQDGDAVCISGKVGERTDVFGRPYRVLEADAVSPLAPRT